MPEAIVHIYISFQSLLPIDSVTQPVHHASLPRRQPFGSFSYHSNKADRPAENQTLVLRSAVDEKARERLRHDEITDGLCARERESIQGCPKKSGQSSRFWNHWVSKDEAFRRIRIGHRGKLRLLHALTQLLAHYLTIFILIQSLQVTDKIGLESRIVANARHWDQRAVNAAEMC